VAQFGQTNRKASPSNDVQDLIISLNPLSVREGCKLHVCYEGVGAACYVTSYLQGGPSFVCDYGLSVADNLDESLSARYLQRRKTKLVSVLQFLTDPVSYTLNTDFLEIHVARKVLEDLSDRLYSTAAAEDNSNERGSDECPSTSNQKDKSYATKLKYQFQATLAKVSSPKEKKVDDIDAAMALAAKTRELTSDLDNIRQALEIVPASSVGSENQREHSARPADSLQRLEIGLETRAWTTSVLINLNLQLSGK
jgi:hypothetical protein